MRTIEVFRLLGPINKARRQATDWKLLHKDLQEISVAVIQVRSLIAGREGPCGFMPLWQDCSDRIEGFIIKLSGLLEETSRDSEMETKEKKWLDQLGKCRTELDDILGSENIDKDPFLQFERMSAKLLGFLDERIQMVITGLDVAVGKAMDCLVEPPATS